MEPLTGIFLAGAIVCGVGLVRTLLGYPVTWAELWLFFGVACSYTAWRWHQRLAAWVRLEELRNDERALAVERQRRALVMPPAPVMVPAAPEPVENDTERAWRLALERFFRAGDGQGGFSIRKLDGVVGSDVWGRLTEFYCSDAGGRVLRVAPGDVGTVWGWGWQLDRVLQLLAVRRLPHPEGAPPEVQLYIAHTTRRDSKLRRATGVIVDGKLSNENSKRARDPA